MAKNRVLIIDDEKLLVKSTCMVLDIYGFETRGALDGEEGVKMAEEFGPDVILLDIMMPGMDGWQVLNKLKQNEITKDIPVLIFTAKEYANGKKLAESRGAVDYIPKPFETDELDAIIRKYLTKAEE